MCFLPVSRAKPPKKFAAKLIDLSFVEELRARGDLPAWRWDDDKGPMALRITMHGLKAIAVEDADPGSHEANADSRRE